MKYFLITMTIMFMSFLMIPEIASARDVCTADMRTPYQACSAACGEGKWSGRATPGTGQRNCKRVCVCND